MKAQLPQSFRPLLWSLRWQDLDVDEDKHDIIVNTINDGTMEQWRWLAQTYGAQMIRDVAKEHLPTEFHPESRNLAKVLFNVTQFHAPRSINSRGAGFGGASR